MDSAPPSFTTTGEHKCLDEIYDDGSTGCAAAMDDECTTATTVRLRCTAAATVATLPPTDVSRRNPYPLDWRFTLLGGSFWFAPTNEVLSIKVIRNKATGLLEGYGFVEFASHATPETVLQTYNRTQVPGTELHFRLNRVSSGIGERRPDADPEHSIFLGDLAPDVTDHLLQKTFRTQYSSGAKVVTNANTGRSKGYGFIQFADEMERNRAMTNPTQRTNPRLDTSTPAFSIWLMHRITLD